ncbi:MAG TPA: T9SS type A sorting domain-containing protein [Bacteroidia bacterium]|nr:T9SS type A sorting domain-containing protein [Bacteroidia bacterium]
MKAKLIYKKKIYFLFSLIALLSFKSINSFSFSGNILNLNKKQTPSSSILASSAKMNLEWIHQAGKNVIVIASLSNEIIDLANGNEYIPSSYFGSGTACGKGFIIYKGNQSSIKVSGLTAGTVYHFSIYEYDATGRFTRLTPQFFVSEKTEEETIALKTVNPNPNHVQNAAPVICPAIAGITCTLNGTSSSSYLGAPAGCNAGSFAGSNPWDGGSSAGFVSWSFSAPVSSTVLKAGSVNTNDSGTNVLTGGSGGTGSVSSLVCLSTVAGMVISFFTSSCCGDVAWQVNSTGSFTTVTLNNTGGQSGWIAECPSAITPASVLPIELVSLNAECNGDAVNLKWQTLTEKNNSYFTVERSYDTQNWEGVGQIPGAGNSSTLIKYEFTDKYPLKTTIYYRLKQTDLDRIFKYSELITAENCKGKDEFSIYPNPAGQEVFIKTNEEVTLEIYNILGEKTAFQILKAGENKIDLSNFNKGTYFFKVSDSSSIIKFSKVIVN